MPPLRGSIAEAEPSPPAESRTFTQRTSKRRLLLDRAARWGVRAGGLTIIASILGILLFLLLEVLPLAGSAAVQPAASIALPGPPLLALVTDEYRSHLVGIDAAGAVQVVRVADGTVLPQEPLRPPGSDPITGVIPASGASHLVAATSGGAVLVIPVAFDISFDDDRRLVTPRVGPALELTVDLSRRSFEVFTGHWNAEDQSAFAAAVTADGKLVVVRVTSTRNPMTDEVSTALTSHATDAPSGLTHLVVDGEQRSLYGGTSDGRLFWWSLEDGAPGEPRIAFAGGSPVTALTLLIGDRSLVVGQANGSLSVWFRVLEGDRTFELTRVRDFPAHHAALRFLSPSWRGKGFVALDAAGQLGLYFSTSERVLWRGASPLPGATAVFYAPKADGAFLAGPGTVAALDIDSPHPEVSVSALFGRVWYEGYPAPAFVWQSTGGTDDFESKLSLTPLVVGTLKGTFFSLILAIPLGVLSAMYASQFMHPSVRRFVKPTVEIMAALPSVVLGFLAGLWLAPRVERVLPGLVLMIPILFVTILLTGRLWMTLPRAFRGRFPAGTEVVLHVVTLAAGIWVSVALSGSVEAWLFGGNIQDWLLRTTGLGYDQRNAVVVGLAMGFAVIPIIFAIAEDAFSNVPANLVSGSLALGANRWQTVTRVVFPTASPGIFSAVMVGFGRAVGETMIVLMATGNTPILDWNPFNGFRTLSANIAVEIAEAPHGGTLYRTLFLAALLLFAVTFAVNTVAELVRQRLRRRYAQL